MDRIVDCIVLLIQPFFYLLFIAIFIIFIVKPLFKYLTVNKIIREEKVLHKEYTEHKQKVKQERLAARQAREEKLQQTFSGSTGNSSGADPG